MSKWNFFYNTVLHTMSNCLKSFLMFKCTFCTHGIADQWQKGQTSTSSNTNLKWWKLTNYNCTEQSGWIPQPDAEGSLFNDSLHIKFMTTKMTHLWCYFLELHLRGWRSVIWRGYEGSSEVLSPGIALFSCWLYGSAHFLKVYLAVHLGFEHFFIFYLH